jgi:hypothetical protein
VCAFTNLTRLLVERGANIADARVEVGHTVSPCWFNGHWPCGSAFAALSGHRANAQCIVLALIVRDFHALDAPGAPQRVRRAFAEAPGSAGAKRPSSQKP